MPIFEFVQSSGKDETTKRELKKSKFTTPARLYVSFFGMFWNNLWTSAHRFDAIVVVIVATYRFHCHTFVNHGSGRHNYIRRRRTRNHEA
jgi:hypothetical protein